MVDQLDPASRLRLSFIVENAAEHIRLGLDLIGRPELVNERNAPVLSLLSFGTEHLLKATWVAAVSLRTGIPPGEGKLKSFGHRILDVHDEVVIEAAKFSRESAQPGICTVDRAMQWRDEDLAWMKSSEGLRLLLHAMQTYGSAAGRYVHFTTILNGEASHQAVQHDPKAAWEAALESIWQRSKGFAVQEAQKAGTDAFLDVTAGYHEESADLVRRVLNRYFRSVGRWWWCGLLGNTARTFAANSVDQFVMLPYSDVATQ